jgi:TetR/AcrR family fatty acid metabolism transcriptional regulator
MTPEIIAADSNWPYSKAKTSVLSAAAAVIREEGPRAATLKNIASRAGITEPAIFRHFDGVDGLFSGLFTAFERIWARFALAFEADSASKGLDRLRKALPAIAELLVACGDYAYLVVHAEHVFRGYPELRERVTELKSSTEAAALACVAAGVKDGDIRSDVDPSSIVASAIGMFYFTAIAWIESGFAFDLCEVCEVRWEDIERFISTKPVARSAERSPRLRTAALRVEAPALHKDASRARKAAKPQPGAKKGGAVRKASASKSFAETKARPKAKKR